MPTFQKNEMLPESMACSTTMAQCVDLNDFLIKHRAKDNQPVTHTRIGNKQLGIYGGAYHIPPEELPEFYNHYCTHVFVNKKKEYLTEKQLSDDTGPLLVDLDFRYDLSVKERLHTEEHVTDIIQVFLEEIKHLMKINDKATIPVYVFEKPTVNCLPDKTKDGLHMIFGIQMCKPAQIMIRNEMIKQLSEVVDLPLQNTWDTIYDDGICKGSTNWQLYGSQKPGNECYKLTYYFSATMETNEWGLVKNNVSDVNVLNEFPKFTAQYSQHQHFDLSPPIQEEINALQAKSKKTTTKPPPITTTAESTDSSECENFDLDKVVPTLTSHEALQKAVDNMLASLDEAREFYVRETHEYTQILPEAYYAPGSHNLNTKVAFALKHTDNRLFVSWIMLRSKAEDFSFDDVPNQYRRWLKDFNPKLNGKAITRASIIYWVKQEAPEEFERIRNNSLNQLIVNSLSNSGDWDYAMVLYHLFKDKFVSTGKASKPTWYVFKNHKWEEDKANRLRSAISTELCKRYAEKQTEILQLSGRQDIPEGDREKYSKQLQTISKIIIKFKTTGNKNNIMHEAADIFFDSDFEQVVDSNPHLLCFTNGVFDFKTKEFRAGQPQDYITKSTGNMFYTKEDLNKYHQDTIIELHDFMAKLFPIERLRNYMWDHLASCLIGDKKEHSLNIYKGSGANGKSLLTYLMSKALNDMFAVIPIVLLCSERSKLGSATPEIMSLKAVRYAVSQEPSKNMIINDGIMKELTGGDPLTGRALYGNTITFIPQFTFALCTNWHLKVNDNGDGTWRRMKEITFMSKFASPDEKYTDNAQYVFPKDKTLKDKIPLWAPVFLSMLTHRACETNGEVVDCPEVIAASLNYRQSQDSLSSFIAEKLEPCENEFGVSQQSLNAAFKEWFLVNVGQDRPPKVTELQEAVSNKFGSRHPKKNKWYTFKIREEIDDDDDMAIAK